MPNTNFNQSSIFSGITWNTGSLTQQPAALGSDLFLPVWAHNGHLYSGWGDGGGFTGSNTLGRVQWGVARIEGASFAARSCYNVYGGNSAQSPEWPVHPNTPNSDPLAYPNNWKLGALWCANSILYALQGDNSWWESDAFVRWRVIKSTNASSQWRLMNGNSLDQGTWTCTSVGIGDTWGPYFYQIGQNNALTPASGYVFGMYVRSVNNYALRAPLSTIGSKDTYEYHTGSNWSTNFANAEKKFEHNNIADPRMFYLAQYNRHFMAFQTVDGTADWILLDAPDPWGPWTKVGQWTDFVDTTRKFGYAIVDKWVSSGNNDVTLLFTGVGTYDNFSAVPGTFSLYDAPGSGSDPGSYSASSWSTYAGSQSWVREVDGGDVAFNTILGGAIVAGAIGAREAAIEWISAQHVVVGGMNGATIIQSGTVTTDCVGTNELIAHTANIKDAIVTTLKIGTNQVTVPVGVTDLYGHDVPTFSIAPDTVNPNSCAALVSGTINTHGYPVQIMTSGRFNNYTTSKIFVFMLTVNSSTTPLWLTFYNTPAGATESAPFAFAYSHSPSSGTQFYKVVAYQYDVTSSAANADRTSLLLLECQR